MFSDKTKKYRLAESKEDFIKQLNDTGESTLQLGFGEVLFKKEGGQIYAFKNKCPHQGARLNGCRVHEEKIICPLHQYGFNTENGRGHGMYLEIYPLEEQKDGFYLLRTYFSWLGE